ncbi:hypothetical protein KC19_7G053400 [Ceratodon purpureus]|uniref:C2 NT-type domain-containing protein n=1 Tax=Ceratodon purpureus TaxID=3225 RepID=A0A8T0H2I0_CERPU|nr:hypothetical protein KC19_7G053400 [Ceratodon purpureus]
MFFRGQKGTPVKFEFDIFVEDLKPWTSAQSQSDGPPVPLVLTWRRGSKRSGSTKGVMPTGGRVVFNEGFKLPATLFERSSGQIQTKCVTFGLVEDESAKAVKISRQLATGELDLSQFGNSTEPRSASIPLSVGHGGNNAERAEPTLSLRISSGRVGSPSSIFSGRLSSGGRTDSPQRRSYVPPESTDESGDDETDEIDSFTDDDESPRSSDNESSRSIRKNPPLTEREMLFSSSATASPAPLNALKSSPALTRTRSASPATRSYDGQKHSSSSDAKAAEETAKHKRESPRLSEEEKRKRLLGVTLPAPPGKALAKAAKTLEAAAASAGKTVEAARISAEKGVEAVRNSSAGKNLEAVAASAAKSVDDVATSLGKSVVTAAAKASAAAYAAKKLSLTKDGRPSESSTSESPRNLAPPDSGGRPDLSGMRPADSSASTSSSTHQSAIAAREEKLSYEKRGPITDDQTDGPNKSVLAEARAKMAMVEKRAIEELRSKVAAAEARTVASEEKGKEIARGLKDKLLKQEDELRDTAAIEVALYSVVAEHASSSHKVHTPARRLARLYVHAFKNWTPERRASSARNSVQGLVVVVRACGNDVPRLTYWWSNIVVLRESIMEACNVEPADSDGATTSGSENSFADRAKQYQMRRQRNTRQGSTSDILGFKTFNNDWQDCNTYVVALLKVETWIHGRILECVWWQAMAPPMQVGGSDRTAKTSALGETFIDVRDQLSRLAGKVKDGLGELNKFAGDVKEFFTKERQDGKISQLGDPRQGIISIEIWKNAFADALKRLCPLQGHEAECGCLPVLSRQVIAECVDRLDVAMFNGIMRNPEEDSPTDPLADPVTDLSVLPIPVGALTFGAGSQLKNAVVTWSTWLSTLLNVKDPGSSDSNNKDSAAEQSEPVEDKKFNLLKVTGDLLMLPKDMIDMAKRREAARREAEKGSPYFVLLRAAGDLLMLPKDMLMNKSVRKEVCPQLKLPLIRRMLLNFVPDEFAPDPVSPSLVAAINTEVSLERQIQGEAEMSIEDISVAPVPIVLYVPPSSSFVRLWIGEPPGTDDWGKTSSSLLRKGYGSDDELDHFQTPLEWLKESPNTRNSAYLDDRNTQVTSADDSQVFTRRYQLLKEVWGT